MAAHNVFVMDGRRRNSVFYNILSIGEVGECLQVPCKVNYSCTDSA